jgi:6-phosphogluconolactonase
LLSVFNAKPKPKRAALMNKLEYFKDLETASKKACAVVKKAAEKALKTRGWFSLAISGGTTPRKFLSILSHEKDIAWQKARVFLVDERLVPTDSPESNLGQAQKLFLDHVPIPREHVYAPQTDMPPDQSAKAYEKQIHAVFNQKLPVFDIIHLGMGTDGHTASLFPGSPHLEEKYRLAVGVPPIGNPALPRVSMTFPLINAARIVFFLLQGEQKAAIIEQISHGQSRLPSARIQPKRLLYWLLAK